VYGHGAEIAETGWAPSREPIRSVAFLPQRDLIAPVTALADAGVSAPRARRPEGRCCDTTTRRAAFARRTGTVISTMSPTTGGTLPFSGTGTMEKLNVVAWARVHGRGLLFVDDNHFLLEATARAFRRVGASCRTAGSHEEGVRAVEEDAKLKVVILDFEMPDGDVRQLVRRLRAARSDILLVGTSGGDRQRDFAERGVKRFVPKPWSLDELVHAVTA
jgi:CheY-like chemotaxis protein